METIAGYNEQEVVVVVASGDEGVASSDEQSPSMSRAHCSPPACHVGDRTRSCHACHERLSHAQFAVAAGNYSWKFVRYFLTLFA